MKVETTIEKHIAGTYKVRHQVQVDDFRCTRESILETSFLNSNFDQVMDHHMAELKQALKREQEVYDRHR